MLRSKPHHIRSKKSQVCADIEGKRLYFVKSEHHKDFGSSRRTSLGQAGTVQTVPRLVRSGHQGLSEAAVGEERAVRRAAGTGPVAGEVSVIVF